MMRKFLYILSFLLCVSCSQSEKKSQDASPAYEDLKVKENTFTEEDGWHNDTKREDLDFKSDDKSKDYNFTINYFSLDNLNSEISTKLQANYEAQILAIKHPEFAETIKEQLADSNKFTESLSDSIQTIMIEDIKFSGSLQSVNDSIYTQKMVYTSLINSKYKQRDSVLVVLKRATIKIDNDAKMNTSFTFEKLDN